MEIKMKLNELFEEKGIRKKHVAKQIGVDATTISNWVSGKSYPKLNQAVQLADILNCDITDLYERTD